MSAARHPLPYHEPRAASNEPETVTLTIRIHDYIDADGYGMGGRLEAVMDESGNVMAILGLDPGSVKHCPKCQRRVYVPDAFEDESAICPFIGCHGLISRTVAFGDLRVEDVPDQLIGGGGECREQGHGRACLREAEAPL